MLWDIDHTLIDGSGVSHQVYAVAFEKTAGFPMQAPWRFDGRTELAAVTESLRAHGLDPQSGLLNTFTEVLVAEMRDRAADMAADGHVLPGGADTLTTLGAVPGVHQSVLTGNLRKIAQLKMRTFGLADHVDFRLGAYGDDAFERTALPAHAFDRTERHLGRRYTGADTVIVGDTLRDIATAHAAGARIVAVATGAHTVEELEAGGADVVLPDLANTDAVRQAVGV